MKPTKTIIAACAMAIMLASAPARAEDAPAAPANYSYGVIDMTKAMKDTEAAKGVIKQLDAKRAEFQKKIQKQEDALRAGKEEIVKQKDKLSEEDFNKKRVEFEKKVAEVQKLVQESKRTLDDAFLKAMDDMRGRVAKITAEIAKERGYAAVLTQEAVIMSSPGMDMTEEVIKRMNKEYKKVDVDWSASKK